MGVLSIRFECMPLISDWFCLSGVQSRYSYIQTTNTAQYPPPGNGPVAESRQYVRSAAKPINGPESISE